MKSKLATSVEIEKQFQRELEALEKEKDKALKNAVRADAIDSALSSLKEKHGVSAEEVCAVAKPDLKKLATVMKWSETDIAEAFGLTLRKTGAKRSGKAKFYKNPLTGSIIRTANPAQQKDLTAAKAAIKAVDNSVFKRYNQVECSEDGALAKPDDYAKIEKAASKA